MKGLMKFLSPMAPDISGAVSVLFDKGGMIVILDAGGCTGNVCGFDEPRWMEGPAQGRSVIFSAGLRDLDAIFGRDEHLMQKIAAIIDEVRPRFLALVGSPVPSVIGTDFRALRRMAENRFGVPVITIPVTGMELCDRGEKLAYKAYLERFPWENGILGATPLNLLPGDTPDILLMRVRQMDHLPELLHDEQGPREGLSAEVDTDHGDAKPESTVKAELFPEDAGTKWNLAVSPAALFAAEKVMTQDKIPYRAFYPLPAWLRAKLDSLAGVIDPILIVHQALIAESMRMYLLDRGCQARIQTGTWFTPLDSTDMHFQDEDDFTAYLGENQFGTILADPLLARAAQNGSCRWVDLPHFAVSG